MGGCAAGHQKCDQTSGLSDKCGVMGSAVRLALSWPREGYSSQAREGEGEVTKYLVVLLWPAGLAVIIGLALVLARRNPQQAPAIAHTARPRLQSAPGSHKAPGDGFPGAQRAMSLSRMLILIAIGAVKLRR